MKIDPGSARRMQETVSSAANEVRQAAKEAGAGPAEQVQQSAETRQTVQKGAEDRKGSMNLNAGILARQLSGAAEKSAGANGGGNSGTQSASGLAQKQTKQMEDGRKRNPIDVHNLKPNINLKDITREGDGTSGKNRTDGVRGLDPKNSTFPRSEDNQVKVKGGLRGLENKAIDTGLNNRGTFGDERLNRGRRTDTNDFRGSGAGNTSRKGKDDSSNDFKQTGTGTDDRGSYTTSRNERGDTMTVWKTDNGEISLFQRKDGTSIATYEDKEGLPYKTVKTEKDGSQTVSIYNESTDKFDRTKTDPFGMPVKMPNPESDEPGQWKPVELKGTNPGREMKGAMKPGGQAGGADDGRNPDANPAGGSSEHAGTSILMGTTGGQEAKEVESGGTINFDKVLEINTKINPTRD